MPRHGATCSSTAAKSAACLTGPTRALATPTTTEPAARASLASTRPHAGGAAIRPGPRWPTDGQRLADSTTSTVLAVVGAPPTGHRLLHLDLHPYIRMQSALAYSPGLSEAHDAQVDDSEGPSRPTEHARSVSATGARG
jgi:hypothetical protein